jgi:CBS-domain-containing membrane protein
MRAKDVMTADVICVAPDASVIDVAELLVSHRISAVPVVSGGTLVGIVSEASLMHRHEIGTSRDPADRPWWIRLFTGEQSPAGYVESHAAKVADIMSAPVVSVGEDTPVSQIADLFERHGIKRVPVVAGGRVTGIVSRSDLLRALAAKGRTRRDGEAASDDVIRSAVLSELVAQPWWRPRQVDVEVANGVVHYSGLLDSPEEARAARVAAENIPGVRAVEDHRIDSVSPAIGYW